MNNFPVAHITGTGHSVPDNILTNFDLEKIVDTSDEWIVSRTGIRERRIAPEGIMNSDYCTNASHQALDEAGVAPEEIEAIVLGTVSGDVDFPATACYVQEKLGAVNAVAFDVSAACSGFIYALSVGNSFFATGNYKNVLVIGAETLSRIINWKDRNTCIIFGDGAGAAVLQPSINGKGILSDYLKSDGRLSHLLMNPGFRGGKEWLNPEGGKMTPHLNMQGREVFKHAVRMMKEASLEALNRASKSIEDVDLLIPHQANVRIMELLASRLGLGKDKVYMNIDRFGNTSAGTIPIALNEARVNGVLKEGDLCLMTVFGGGFTWGATLVQF